MTFQTDEVIRVLDEVLPAKFGGGPGSYQLLEQETPDGRAEVLLLASPQIGPLEEDLLIEAFLEALGSGSIVNQMMCRMWKEARLLRVERREPSNTRSGKVLHFHVSPSRQRGDELRLRHSEDV